MNGLRKSDSLIVSKIPLNKMRDNKRMAEEEEKSGLAGQGESVEQNKYRTQRRETLKHEFGKIRQAAKSFVRHYLRQEPSAVVPHAGICTGGAG